MECIQSTVLKGKWHRKTTLYVNKTNQLNIIMENWGPIYLYMLFQTNKINA